MSDKILRALMQLFAIVANSGEISVGRRNIVEAFLHNHLSDNYVQLYLKLFDEFLEKLTGQNETGKARKKISVNSVKVLRICSDINKELDQKQKLVVLVRLLEFVSKSADSVTEQHDDFINTVAETFSIDKTEYENIRLLSDGNTGLKPADKDSFLYAGHHTKLTGDYCKFPVENLNGLARFLYLRQTDFLLFRYDGTDTLFLNGRIIHPGSINFFEQGGVIRGSRMLPVYYNNVRLQLLGKKFSTEFSLQALKLGYSFKGNKTGLHPLTFTAESGNLIGIMGNSGSGKSTLLSLLNGSIKPTRGQVIINGEDLHENKARFSGLIGNIPQDDLLIEELTVYQNLFYSAKLYFGELSEMEVGQKVNECLVSLGLYSIKDLAVGDPLNKFISGGQRKRLNIALELIREPAILFVDEPTSGLSSGDSENVMDLLKHLTLEGKLIFVVIHQPSSDIFKLFDELLLLDTGGYPVYYGNPVDSIAYFKREMNYADPENSECVECGNINSEEVFKILELKTIDEFGRATKHRKIDSETWYKLFNKNFAHVKAGGNLVDSHVSKFAALSSKLNQYFIYFKRNLLTKLNNRQYLLITLLEAPALAAILAVALRYQQPGKQYVFGYNPNMPAYFFICTIVALFFGLIGSAEEIINDKKILKRESFLRLSRSSYLLSKVSYLFMVSLLQAVLFVVTGHYILGIHDLWTDACLVFFSVSCFGNLLGLNISAGLKTRVAVYILVPFLVIPQIMLSGTMVKFEELSPVVGSDTQVPFVGNIMASRWAIEALLVNQFKNNDYEKTLFSVEQRISNAGYRKDHWLGAMEEEIHKNEMLLQSNQLSKQDIDDARYFIGTEFKKLKAEYPVLQLKDVEPTEAAGDTKAWMEDCKYNLQLAGTWFLQEKNAALVSQAAIKDSLVSSFASSDEFKDFKSKHVNDNISEVVKNSLTKQSIVFAHYSFFRKYQPVYMQYKSEGIFSAPYYVYSKALAGCNLETIWFNLLMIWGMTLILYCALYFDALRRLLEFG